MSIESLMSRADALVAHTLDYLRTEGSPPETVFQLTTDDANPAPLFLCSTADEKERLLRELATGPGVRGLLVVMDCYCDETGDGMLSWESDGQTETLLALLYTPACVRVRRMPYEDVGGRLVFTDSGWRELDDISSPFRNPFAGRR